MRPTVALVATLVASVLAVAAAACGGDDPVVQRSPGPESREQAALAHIHGLGVGPGDGTLYVATHGGLFEVADGQEQLRRVGDSTQDVMGFAVVGSDHFIGSGHPAPDDSGLPPNLGLIESRDAGRTWQSISLLGKVDFHVLRSAGRRIYGFDGASGRLMVSNDGGRRWLRRTPPAPMFDLAIQPRRQDRLVSSTQRGIFTSDDAGATWRPLRTDTAGLLAWPAGDRLYLVDAQGRVEASGDRGSHWRSVGSVGGQPAAFTGAGSELYVALAVGTIKRSDDGGATHGPCASPRNAVRVTEMR